VQPLHDNDDGFSQDVGPARLTPSRYDGSTTTSGLAFLLVRKDGYQTGERINPSGPALTRAMAPTASLSGWRDLTHPESFYTDRRFAHRATMNVSCVGCGTGELCTAVRVEPGDWFCTRCDRERRAVTTAVATFLHA
jgi:hypothetical protein